MKALITLHGIEAPKTHDLRRLIQLALPFAPKQIDYWRTSSEEDFAAAESLLEKGHLRRSLFFAHLAIEKMLKAHVTLQTKDIPPRIHSLIRLTGIVNLKLEMEWAEFLREFGVYQLEGRYPDSEQVSVDPGFARDELSRAKEMLAWLKKQLLAK